MSRVSMSSDMRDTREESASPQLETALPTVASLDELARYVLQEPDICVRYSAGPLEDRGRPSVDDESGLLLPGLSAAPLKPEPWWTRDRRDWIARQLNHYIHLKDDTDDRRAWLLIGRIAGYGPDREPLLWPWTPVAWIDGEVVEEARCRYREQFDVSRDSRGT